MSRDVDLDTKEGKCESCGKEALLFDLLGDWICEVCVNTGADQAGWNDD